MQISKLRGLIDLEKVPSLASLKLAWDSSRARWEVEARGEFTILRLHRDSMDHGLKDVRSRYKRKILAHAGLRLIGEYILKQSRITTKQLHRT